MILRPGLGMTGDVIPKDDSRSCAVESLFRDDAGMMRAAAVHFRNAGEVVECTMGGGSMGESVPRGARIRISFSAGARYRPGQVIAFTVGRRVFVHRVVYRGRGARAHLHLITRGDATLTPDPPLNLEHVLGLVTELRTDGPWRPLAPAPRRRLRFRVVRFILLAAVAAVLEINVELARRLAAFQEVAIDRFQRWLA